MPSAKQGEPQSKSMEKQERESIELFIAARQKVRKAHPKASRITIDKHTEEQIFEIGEQRQLSEVQIAMALQAHTNPAYHKEMLRQYTVRCEQKEQKAEASGPDEPNIAVCRQFLTNWEKYGMSETAPYGGSIPGYSTQGAPAVRQVLAGLPEAPPD